MNAMDMFRPTPEANLQRPFNLGRVFYVDNGIATASDSNEGTDPNHPLAKVQAGIDKCTDNQGDYVMVLDCYQEDTSTILLNSATSHVIGLSTPASAGWTVLDGQSNDLITLSGNYMEFAGFSLIATGKDAIHVSTGAGGYCWLHNLNFATHAGTLVNGIEFDGTSAFTNSLVEDCYFGCTVTSLSGTAITGNGIFYTVRNCMFRRCGTKCINVSAPETGGGWILHNYFDSRRQDSDPAGWAITLGSANANQMVAENYASHCGGGTEGGNNPYLDDSAATDPNVANNAWCMNYWGDNVIDPLYHGE